MKDIKEMDAATTLEDMGLLHDSPPPDAGKCLRVLGSDGGSLLMGHVAALMKVAHLVVDSSDRVAVTPVMFGGEPAMAVVIVEETGTMRVIRPIFVTVTDKVAESIASELGNLRPGSGTQLN